MGVVIAIQAEYADVQELIPQASSLLTYLQLLGAAIGISYVHSLLSALLEDNCAPKWHHLLDSFVYPIRCQPGC